MNNEWAFDFTVVLKRLMPAEVICVEDALECVHKSTKGSAS